MATQETVSNGATSAPATKTAAEPPAEKAKPVIGAKPVDGKVLALHLHKDIFVDPSWNSRFSAEHDASPNEDQMLEGGASWDDFRRSVLAGQDTPVKVRPAPKGATHGKAYELGAGFRRAKAISENAAEFGIEPIILAESKPMTDAEFRRMNIRENTARAQLGSPDLVYGIKALVAKEPNMTSVALAADLGMNQSYVSALMRIAKNLSADVLKKWRGLPDGSRVSYKDILELSKASKTEQTEQFEEMTAGDGGDEDEEGETDKNAWVKKACEKLGPIGNAIGRAVFAKHLVIKSEDFYLEHAADFVKVKKNAKVGQLNRLAKAFSKAVDSGCSQAEAAEASESEEEEEEAE